jgi:hypothetical protein
MCIDIRYFLISLAIGLFYIYISDDYKKVIVIYPTPDNTDQYQFRDKTGSCFSYELNEVKCPFDITKIQDVKIQS